MQMFTSLYWWRKLVDGPVESIFGVGGSWLLELVFSTGLSSTTELRKSRISAGDVCLVGHVLGTFSGVSTLRLSTDSFDEMGSSLNSSNERMWSVVANFHRLPNAGNSKVVTIVDEILPMASQSCSSCHLLSILCFRFHDQLHFSVELVFPFFFLLWWTKKEFGSFWESTNVLFHPMYLVGACLWLSSRQFLPLSIGWKEFVCRKTKRLESLLSRDEEMLAELYVVIHIADICQQRSKLVFIRSCPVLS